MQFQHDSSASDTSGVSVIMMWISFSSYGRQIVVVCLGVRLCMSRIHGLSHGCTSSPGSGLGQLFCQLGWVGLTGRRK